MVEEEVGRAERHNVGRSGLVVVDWDVGRTEELHVHKVAAHGFSKLLNVVRRDHDGSKAVVGVVRGPKAAGEAGGDQHQGKEQRR